MKRASWPAPSDLAGHFTAWIALRRESIPAADTRAPESHHPHYRVTSRTGAPLGKPGQLIDDLRSV
jgi:hypothetical protein